jgi:cysteinyl-tRNA synthetase
VAVRLFYLRTHYRKPLEYSESALVDAEASLARLRAFRRRVGDPVEGPARAETLERFKTAMDDDLDVSGALAVLFDTVREGNFQLDAGADVSDLVAAFDEITGVLGLVIAETAVADTESVAAFATTFGIEDGDVDSLLELRARARADNDWNTADAIRDGLADLDITIEDTAHGARWHRN